jgi:hypothetical protein
MKAREQLGRYFKMRMRSSKAEVKFNVDPGSSNTIDSYLLLSECYRMKNCMFVFLEFHQLLNNVFYLLPASLTQLKLFSL